MLHDVYFLIIRFYEVYLHKPFTLSNDLFQLKDRVSVKYTLLSADKFNHRSQMASFIAIG